MKWDGTIGPATIVSGLGFCGMIVGGILYMGNTDSVAKSAFKSTENINQKIEKQEDKLDKINRDIGRQAERLGKIETSNIFVIETLKRIETAITSNNNR